MKVSLDTNILIDNPEIVLDKTKEFVISFTVIRELDNLKRNPDLHHAAQTAIVNILHEYKAGRVEILALPCLLGDSPDEQIIQDTKDAGASILSNDLAVNLIADAYGVPISEFETKSPIDYSYLGYITIEGTVEYEKEFVQIKEMSKEEFELKFNVTLMKNQYVIIDRVVEKDDIWFHHKGKVTRLSQSSQPLKACGIVDIPLDSEQMCAFLSIMNPDIPLVILDGKVGSGKTLLSLMGALAASSGMKKHKHYSDIIIARPPVSINRGLQVGFLPGDEEEKFAPWIGGIKSNLKFLLEKTEADKTKETAKIVYEDVFTLMNLDSIQGESIHDAIFLLDEYQLLNVDTLKLALGRISKGSKIVLIGDTRGQTYHTNRANEGFKVLFEHLGQADEMIYIRLENIYRSALVEFVEKVFENH